MSRVQDSLQELTAEVGRVEWHRASSDRPAPPRGPGPVGAPAPSPPAAPPPARFASSRSHAAEWGDEFSFEEPLSGRWIRYWPATIFYPARTHTALHEALEDPPPRSSVVRTKPSR